MANKRIDQFGTTTPDGSEYVLIQNATTLGYSKAPISSAVNATSYTKIEVDTSLAGKAEAIHVHAIADTTGLQAALDGKVGKVTTVNTLYGVNGSGGQTSYLLSQASATSSIAQRSSGGTLAVGTPTASAHATTKAYVDTALTASLSTKQDTLVSGTNIKTVNGSTLLGSGDIVIAGGTGGGAVDSVNAQTGVVVLDADDIDDTATTHKFVTSTDITKLSNLSGTNTGDQDLSSYATTAALAAKENIAKVTPIAVSTSTAAGTAAKVATTTGGTYTPTEGDIICVTFTAANTATNPTINIDGSGAKSILLGNVNPTGVAMAGTKVMMWYDGTAFQLFGSQRVSDTSTTYSEISEAEITAGSASTTRSITGRRSKFIIDTAVGNVAAATQTLTNKTISGSNNTLSDIAQASVTNLTSDLAGKASSTHTHAIDDLSDVTISAPSTGQVIKYNGSAWVNDTDATSGGAGATNLSTTLSSTQTVIASDTGTDATIPAVDGTNAGVMTPTQKAKLDGIATSATANSSDATLLARANHTGTQSADTITDGTTNKAYTATEKTKLAGIATGATANTGDVAGPASSTNNNVAMFDGTTGKLLKDSGITLAGSNTGDETTATIKTKLGITTLSGSNTGDQTTVTGSAGSLKSPSTTGVGQLTGMAAGTTRVYTVPNANATLLTSAAAVTVAQGGTGATTLTGILKGNGTSAVTAVTAPTGAIVGTTDTQTLSGKTLTTPLIDTINEQTVANGVTVDGLNIKDGKLNTSNSVVTSNITDAAVTASKFDWSTLPISKGTYSAGDLTVTSTSPTSVGLTATISIPTTTSRMRITANIKSYMTTGTDFVVTLWRTGSIQVGTSRTMYFAATGTVADQSIIFDDPAGVSGSITYEIKINTAASMNAKFRSGELIVEVIRA